MEFQAAAKISQARLRFIGLFARLYVAPASARHTGGERNGHEYVLYSVRGLVCLGRWAPLAFVIATLGCIIWALSGPIFAYSDTWQLVINTATTVLTFLMVFVLQHSQNQDAIAIQAKLDELILHTKHARNDLIEAEKLRSSKF